MTVTVHSVDRTNFEWSHTVLSGSAQNKHGLDDKRHDYLIH